MEVIDTGESHPVSATTSVTVTCSGDNGKQGWREGNHLKGHESLPTRHIPPPHHVSTYFASYKAWLMARFSVKSCHTASAHAAPTLSGFLLFVVWTMPFSMSQSQPFKVYISILLLDRYVIAEIMLYTSLYLLQGWTILPCIGLIHFDELPFLILAECQKLNIFEMLYLRSGKDHGKRSSFRCCSLQAWTHSK